MYEEACILVCLSVCLPVLSVYVHVCVYACIYVGVMRLLCKVVVMYVLINALLPTLVPGAYLGSVSPVLAAEITEYTYLSNTLRGCDEGERNNIGCSQSFHAHSSKSDAAIVIVTLIALLFFTVISAIITGVCVQASSSLRPTQPSTLQRHADAVHLQRGREIIRL